MLKRTIQIAKCILFLTSMHVCANSEDVDVYMVRQIERFILTGRRDILHDIETTLQGASESTITMYSRAVLASLTSFAINQTMVNRRRNRDQEQL